MDRGEELQSTTDENLVSLAQALAVHHNSFPVYNEDVEVDMHPETGDAYVRVIDPDTGIFNLIINVKTDGKDKGSYYVLKPFYVEGDLPHWKRADEGKDILSRYTEIYTAKEDPVAIHRPEPQPEQDAVITDEDSKPENIVETDPKPEPSFLDGFIGGIKGFFGYGEEGTTEPAKPLADESLPPLEEKIAEPEEGAELSFKEILKTIYEFDDVSSEARVDDNGHHFDVEGDYPVSFVPKGRDYSIITKNADGKFVELGRFDTLNNEVITKDFATLKHIQGQIIHKTPTQPKPEAPDSGITPHPFKKDPQKEAAKAAAPEPQKEPPPPAPPANPEPPKTDYIQGDVKKPTESFKKVLHEVIGIKNIAGGVKPVKGDYHFHAAGLAASFVHDKGKSFTLMAREDGGKLKTLGTYNLGTGQFRYPFKDKKLPRGTLSEPTFLELATTLLEIKSEQKLAFLTDPHSITFTNYECRGHTQTIGLGTTMIDGEPVTVDTKPINASTAFTYMQIELDIHYNSARRAFGAEAFDALNEDQQGALTMFTLNTYPGERLIAAVQEGRLGDVPDLMRLYTSVTDVVDGKKVKTELEGLVDRREVEANWFAGNKNTAIHKLANWKEVEPELLIAVANGERVNLQAYHNGDKTKPTEPNQPKPQEQTVAHSPQKISRGYAAYDPDVEYFTRCPRETPNADGLKGHTYQRTNFAAYLFFEETGKKPIMTSGYRDALNNAQATHYLVMRGETKIREMYASYAEPIMVEAWEAASKVKGKDAQVDAIAKVFQAHEDAGKYVPGHMKGDKVDITWRNMSQREQGIFKDICKNVVGCERWVAHDGHFDIAFKKSFDPLAYQESSKVLAFLGGDAKTSAPTTSSHAQSDLVAIAKKALGNPNIDGVASNGDILVDGKPIASFVEGNKKIVYKENGKWTGIKLGSANDEQIQEAVKGLASVEMKESTPEQQQKSSTNDVAQNLLAKAELQDNNSDRTDPSTSIPQANLPSEPKTQIS